MSKVKGNSAPYVTDKPALPCPTSPMQQTDDESWEHSRAKPGSDVGEYDRHRNDHITDRLPGEDS